MLAGLPEAFHNEISEKISEETFCYIFISLKFLGGKPGEEKSKKNKRYSFQQIMSVWEMLRGLKWMFDVSKRKFDTHVSYIFMKPLKHPISVCWES